MAGKEDDIEQYRSGQLSSKERNALEKKALSDPFLEDALDGSHEISSDDFSADLSELAKKIEGNSSKSWLSPLRIAAGIVILIGAASLFFWMDFSERPTMALEKNASGKADSIQDPTESDSSGSLLSLDKTEAPPTVSEQASRKSSLKKIKPSSKKESAPAGDLSPETSAASKIVEAETIKEEPAPVTVEEIKVAEIPVVESAPIVAEKKNELKKSNSNLARSKAKDNSTSDSRTESAGAGSVSLNQTISGKVVSSDDGSPLPGVNVLVKGTTTGTVTDANGKFELTTDVKNPQLSFSFIGLSTVEAKPEQGASLNIEMKDDISQLSEVVVAGYGTQSEDKDREPIIKSAFPAGGLRAYNKYLEDNVKYPIEALESNVKGKVTVEFTIAVNGTLSEFNILKSLGHGCDEEVVRLVKEGPKWNPTTVDNVSVETLVKVKVKFDPAKAKK